MRAVVFDLDGTLIDSEPDIRGALNRLLAERGLAPLPATIVTKMIGDGVRVLVERGLAHYGQPATAADVAAYLADYEAHAVDETAVYPGIPQALAALRQAGHALAVCTNKPAAAAREVLELLGLETFFSVVTGGDSTPYRKPDPRHLAATLAALGTDDAIMIGDHANDMAAAHGLGVPSIFAEWGYGEAAGDFTASSAEMLPDLVAQSSRGMRPVG